MARLDSSIDAIAASLACLQGCLPPDSRVIVFGSRARGDAREDSDIDLLVIEPEVSSRFAEMARLSSVLGRNLIPADVIVMSNADYEAQRMKPNTLAWRATQEGLMHEFHR